MKLPQAKTNASVESSIKIRRSPRISSASKQRRYLSENAIDLDSVKRAVLSSSFDDDYPSPPSPLVECHATNEICFDPCCRNPSNPDHANESIEQVESPAPLATGDTNHASKDSFVADNGAVLINEEPKGKDDHDYKFRCLFFHLNRITASEQKDIAAAFNVAQVGNKKMRASRIFLEMRAIILRRKCSVLDLLEEKEKKRGSDFKTEYNCTMTLYQKKAESTVIPDDQTLMALSGKRRLVPPRHEDKNIDDESDVEEDITAVNFTATSISLEEFSRLMIIFRDIPEAAEDLRKSGQDLSREDLDTGRTRDAFWTDRIEKLFNDSSVLTNDQFESPLQDIDPGRPVTQYRTGSYLKDVFTKFRHEFTEKYANWNVSGNQEFSNFVNFCYIPRTRTLSRSGARCLIAFKVFRFGCPEQNTLLLDFCSKQMAGSSGACLESGLTSNAPSNMTATKSNKRFSDGDLGDEIRSMVRSLSELDRKEDTVAKRKQAEFDDLRLKRARREEDRSVMQQLIETHEHRLKMNHPVDNRVTGIIDNYYKRLVEEADRRMNP